ncbi:MAG: hypothetical protein U0517_01210 [Candidatus Andersenbacteria bacterium]
MTTTSITSGQHKQFKNFVKETAEKALKESSIDKDALQRLIANGGELQSSILAAIKRLSVSNQFAGEEVSSSYVYPAGYKVKPVADQVSILRRYFPGLGPDKKDTGRDLPTGAEGFFAIPRWDKIATSYNEAVEKVLTAIKSTRQLYNYRENQLGADRLRQHQRTVSMFAQIGEQRTGDTLVIPAQFGMRHRGRSVRRAREVFTANEFGLGAFAIGCMLLTHPERLTRYEDLWIDCSGDEYNVPDGARRWFRAPYFGIGGGRVWFGAYWVHHAHELYGSASGFLPQ